MRLLPFSFLICLIVVSPAFAQDVKLDPKVYEAREELVREISDSTLSILQDQKKPFKAREQLLEQGIADMVDTDFIAKFVLGQFWRTATPQQREQYTALYRKYLMHMYIANFAQTSERKICNMRVLGTTGHEADRFTARTEVELSTRQKLHVDYLIAEKGDTDRIIDVIVDGISLLATHRAEFTQIASAEGVEGVIKKLEQ